MAVFTDPIDAPASFQQALDASRTSTWLDAGLSGGGVYPPVNVFRKGDDFIIVAEIPGVKKTDLDVQVNGRTIRLSGSKLVSYSEKAAVHRRERLGGKFDRTVTLPVEIDANGVKAEYRDGQLALFVPRAESDVSEAYPPSSSGEVQEGAGSREGRAQWGPRSPRIRATEPGRDFERPIMKTEATPRIAPVIGDRAGAIIALSAEPLAKFIERGEFSLCSRGGAAGAQAGAGLSCVTRRDGAQRSACRLRSRRVGPNAIAHRRTPLLPLTPEVRAGP